MVTYEDLVAVWGRDIVRRPDAALVERLPLPAAATAALARAGLPVRAEWMAFLLDPDFERGQAALLEPHDQEFFVRWEALVATDELSDAEARPFFERVERELRAIDPGAFDDEDHWWSVHFEEVWMHFD
jgi:SUKH-4 immunity protein